MYGDNGFAPREEGDYGYRVVRFYRDLPGYSRTIIDRCTLEEARAHCQDPETSSSTATSPEAKGETRRMGEWFDGFEER